MRWGREGPLLIISCGDEVSLHVKMRLLGEARGVSFVWAKLWLGKDIWRQKGLEERDSFPVYTAQCPVMTWQYWQTYQPSRLLNSLFSPLFFTWANQHSIYANSVEEEDHMHSRTSIDYPPQTQRRREATTVIYLTEDVLSHHSLCN